VTGGGSGIGAAVVNVAAAQGHFAFAGGRRFASLEKARGDNGVSIWNVPLNVRDEVTCRAAVEEMKKEVSGIDVLVANAGVPYSGAFEETPIHEFKRVLDVNFLGAARMIQSVLPVMREARRGVIIVVSSLSGLIGLPGDSAYAASKFALEGACEALAPEVARFGVKVLIVEPGAVKTEFMADAAQASGEAVPEYDPFRAFLAERAQGRSRGADAADIAEEIVAMMENPEGPLRRPVGDQARRVAERLQTLSEKERAALALDASGLDWWAAGRASS